MSETPIERVVFESEQLMAEHAPVWRDRNKQVVYEMACSPGCHHQGKIIYTRWQAMPLPEQVACREAAQLVESRKDVYDYAPVMAEAVEWHVNFADPNLFVAYGLGLFAQDEMQVAEHPILGALREALLARGFSARTAEAAGPTPVLILGAQRRCRVATDRNASEGRPQGLYGNAFSRAPVEAIRRATTAIDPPTLTNLIAMAAPSGGYGPYKANEMERILVTAYTAFRAAVLLAGSGPAIVHTGFWGCGAFGGNRELMALLQVLAAGTAGVRRLVFHTFDAAGSTAFHTALGRIEKDLPASRIDSRQLLDLVGGMGFQWGVSDGN